MTKEKVIDILKGIKDGTALLIPNIAEDGEKAIDIAIKAVEHPEPHWIPVTERLPKKNGAYLVTAEGFPVSIKFYSADSYGWGEEWRRVITAWMPLPEPFEGVTT